MRHFYQTTTLGLALALALGCASEQHQDAAMARVGDEKPPDFLTGPLLTPLEDFDGFSAQVVAAVSPANDKPAAVGELIGRQGRLIFQPLTTANVKKTKFYRGGMFFIWDVVDQNGFVISEALQGFAQIVFSLNVTNQSALATNPAVEMVNGHPCRSEDLALALTDGSTFRMTAWRADDLQRFPVRLRTENAGREFTVDFTNVRLDRPQPGLFFPPAGFTSYASPQALINELMIREATQRGGPAGSLASPGRTDQHPFQMPNPMIH